MNFDLPKQLKPWENKSPLVFDKWLSNEVNSIPERWSPEFLEYVEIKRKECTEKKEYQETSIEEKKDRTLKRYLDSLKFTEQELQGKSILDVGCGKGEFVVSCMQKGITQKVYGLDGSSEEYSSNEGYSNHFFSQDFTEDFSVRDLDYVISVGAISLYLDEEHKIDVEIMIEKAIEATNKDGEIRIWPIKKALMGDKIDGIREEEKVISEILKKLEEKFSIIWELKPTHIKVSGHDKDVWAEQVLVIRHKNSLASLE